jgi:hypothetical protein
MLIMYNYYLEGGLGKRKVVDSNQRGHFNTMPSLENVLSVT